MDRLSGRIHTGIFVIFQHNAAPNHRMPEAISQAVQRAIQLFRAQPLLSIAKEIELNRHIRRNQLATAHAHASEGNIPRKTLFKELYRSICNLRRAVRRRLKHALAAVGDQVCATRGDRYLFRFETQRAQALGNAFHQQIKNRLSLAD